MLISGLQKVVRPQIDNTTTGTVGNIIVVVEGYSKFVNELVAISRSGVS